MKKNVLCLTEETTRIFDCLIGMRKQDLPLEVQSPWGALSLQPKQGRMMSDRTVSVEFPERLVGIYGKRAITMIFRTAWLRLQGMTVERFVALQASSHLLLFQVIRKGENHNKVEIHRIVSMDGKWSVSQRIEQPHSRFSTIQEARNFLSHCPLPTLLIDYYTMPSTEEYSWYFLHLLPEVGSDISFPQTKEVQQ